MVPESAPKAVWEIMRILSQYNSKDTAVNEDRNVEIKENYPRGKNQSKMFSLVKWTLSCYFFGGETQSLRQLGKRCSALS